MDNKQSPLKCCETDYEQTFDQNYWEKRWQKNETAWDIGHPSPAITEYLDQYPDKNIAILIPGCGNAYEAEYMIKHGFTNITLIDISPKAVERLKLKFKDKKEVEFAVRTKVSVDKNHVTGLQTKNTVVATVHGFIHDDNKDVDAYKKKHAHEWIHILGSVDGIGLIEDSSEWEESKENITLIDEE